MPRAGTGGGWHTGLASQNSDRIVIRSSSRLRRFSAAPTNSRRGGDTAPSYDSSVRRRTPRVHRNRRGTRTVVEGRASIVTSPGGTAAPGSWIHHVGVHQRRPGLGATPPRLGRDAAAPRVGVYCGPDLLSKNGNSMQWPAWGRCPLDRRTPHVEVANY